MSSSFVTTQLNSSPQLGLNLEEEEVADDVVTRVMRIPEILSTILSYLSVRELKNARLVNSLWKALSEIHFKQRVKIRLIGNTYNRKLYKVNMEPFLEICKSHQNYNLNLSYHEETLDYEKEIIHFVVSSLAPLIKFFELSLTINDSNDFKLKFFNVLNNLSNLKELRLDVHLKTSGEVFDVEDIFQAVPQLPLVTKLKLCLAFGRDRESKQTLQKLSQKLLSMTPNLEELRLKEVKRNWGFPSVYLGEIVQLQREWKNSKSKGPMPFQKLAFMKGLYLDESNASETILMSYLEFLQPLKELEICFPRADNELTLQKILHKNSTTLKTLFIDTYEHFNIALPFLPKLTRLSLRDQDVFNLRELFMLGAEEFTSKFPRLHSIELGFPKDFLPSPNCQLELSFPQFTLFEIGWREKRDWDYDDGDVSNKKWGEWFSKLFPNVHNPWINKFRQNLQENM